jgi:hypothetical protein
MATDYFQGSLPGDGEGSALPWLPKNPSNCITGPTTNAYFEFKDPENFEFREELSTSELSGGIYGTTRVIASSESQKVPVAVTVSMSPAEFLSIKNTHFSTSGSSLFFRTPSFDRDGRGESFRPCMVVGVTISVHPDLSVSSFSIKNRNIGIKLDSSLDLNTTKSTLSTSIGSISSEATTLFSSRDTHVHVGTGTVLGHFPLYDLLDVASETGSISIDVIPKPASSSHPSKPAVLSISTRTGSITVHEPPTSASSSSIPDREYRTSLTSRTGSITGNILHGSTTTATTISGTISLDVLPYFHNRKESASTLTTSTRAGMTRIRLLSPTGAKHNSDPIALLTSSHTVQTGSLSLRYPQSWTGTIKGKTTTGSLTLRGKDVSVDKWDEGWVSRKVEAHKGDGKGSITFSATTGSAEVVVGEEVGGLDEKEKRKRMMEMCLGEGMADLLGEIADLWGEGDEKA